MAPGTEKGTEVLPMVLRLQKAKPRTIGIGVGFGSEEGPRGKVRWLHRNLFNRGWREAFEIRASSLELEVSNRIDIPRVFHERGRLAILSRFGQESEEDYNLVIGATEVGWHWDFDNGQTLGVGLGVRHLDLDSDPSLLRTLHDPPESAWLGGPFMSWAGERSWGRSHFNASSRLEFSPDLEGGEAGLVRQENRLRFRRRLTPEWTFSQANRLGWIQPLGVGRVPVSERFATGGTSRVRGYARRELGPRNGDLDILGGLSLMEFSSEIHRSIFLPDLEHQVRL